MSSLDPASGGAAAPVSDASSAPARPRSPSIVIDPIAAARGVARLPGSKSISNRVLLLAALAEGTSRLDGLLDADDTRVMIDALRKLGIAVERSGACGGIDDGDTGGDASGDITTVTGGAGSWPVRDVDLYLGNAGTAMRPLTAALAFSGGRYRLDGVARMRERPIGDLVDALNAVGAQIRYEGQSGYPPLLITPARALSADRVRVRGAVSSQFLSGLLMAAPIIAPADGLRIDVDGALISAPYVAMTVALIQRFGVAVERVDGADGATGFLVPRATYRAQEHLIVEGDASAASYFVALGALAGGPVRVIGAGRDSVQGDVAFADLAARMGVVVRWGPDWIEAERGARLVGIEADCTQIPDAAMTACILALFADGPTTLRGIGSWRVKETDRIAAMATELRKLGATVDEGADWIRVRPPARLRAATIETYDDHRMAMCFALAAAGGVAVEIEDPRCVDKTFPAYFDVLRSLIEAPAASVR